MDVLSSLANLRMSTADRKDLQGLSSSKSNESLNPKSKDSFNSALRQSSSEGSNKTLEKNSHRDVPQKPAYGPQKGWDESRQPSEKEISQAAPSPLQRNATQEELQNQQITRQEAVKKEEVVDSIPKRLALQTFIQKMRDEVGVDANDITEALQNLTSQELAMPPAQNIEKILDSLGLVGEQREKAQFLFQDFLKQTASNSLADHLKTSGRQLSMQVLSNRELKEQALKASLEKMNQNFFVHPHQQRPVTEEKLAAGEVSEDKKSAMWATLGLAPASAAASSGAAAGTATAASSGAGSSAGMILPAGMEAVTPTEWTGEVPVSSGLEEGGSEWTSASGSENAGAGLEDVSMSELEAPKPPPVKTQSIPSLEEQLRGFKLQKSPTVVSKQAQAAYEMAPAKVMSQVSPPASAGAETAAGAAIGAFGGLAMMSAGDGESSGESSGENLSQDSLLGLNQQQVKDVKGEAGPRFEVSMQPTQKEDAANMKELIHQAQFLSKKGGGEMKVALNPEGLGEVAMKVSVENGQVNVEMVTESNEAKKLLEKGMGELKASLASHKLNVENIKVDFQGEISKHMQDQRNDAERQFAQQFLENFRHENQGWRRNFFDIPGAQSVRGQTEDSEREALLVEQSRKSQKSNRRLDLVA